MPLESLLRRSTDPDAIPGWYHDVAALLFALLFFLLGNTAQLWDRDEPRYAEASRVMNAGGDWAVPEFNGAPRYKKPPAIYWLQAISYEAFGVSEWSARLPATIFAALTVWLLFRFVRRRTGRLRAAWLTVAAFSLCLMTVIQSGASTIDSVLLTFITALMLEWPLLTATRPRMRNGRPVPIPARKARWVFWWALMAVAILLKFPVPIAVVGCALILFYAFRPRELGPFVRQLLRDSAVHGIGIGVLLLLVVPWVIAAQSATDGEFMKHLVGFEILERAAQAQEGHGGPPIYYLVALPLFWAPWPLLLLVTWRHVPDGLDRRTMVWMIAWALGTVGIFSIASTKLPHYVFPAFPPLAVLTGVALDQALARRSGIGWWRGHVRDGFSRTRGWTWTALAGLCWLVTLAAVALPVAVLVLDLGAMFLPVLAVAVFLGVASFLAGRSFLRGDIRAVAVHTCWGALVVCGLGVGWAGTAFDAYKPGRSVGHAIRTHVPSTDGRPLYCCGYDESSLTFYTRCHTVTVAHQKDEDGRGFDNRSWEDARFWRWLRARHPHEPALILMRREPDEAGTLPAMHARDDAAREWLTSSRLRRVGPTMGPFFHYNQGRNCRFYLELWVLEPDPGDAE